jgi:hypothetical protein
MRLKLTYRYSSGTTPERVLSEQSFRRKDASSTSMEEAMAREPKQLDELFHIR